MVRWHCHTLSNGVVPRIDVLNILDILNQLITPVLEFPLTEFGICFQVPFGLYDLCVRETLSAST
jgi:hypothetical protein